VRLETPKKQHTTSWVKGKNNAIHEKNKSTEQNCIVALNIVKSYIAKKGRGKPYTYK